MTDDARRERAEARRRQRARHRAHVIRAPSGVVWTLVPDARAREPARVDGLGRDVQVPVDTDVFCYRMVCLCGRIRFAKPNTLHQVVKCRVCARATRLGRRAALERGKGVASLTDT